MHIVQGFGDPLAGAMRLQLALKGLKRSKPKAKVWEPGTLGQAYPQDSGGLKCGHFLRGY